MGILLEYFSAATDADATAMGEQGGPSRVEEEAGWAAAEAAETAGTPDQPATAAARPSLWRRLTGGGATEPAAPAPAAEPEAAAIDWIDGVRLTPWIELPTLEHVLTGRSVDELIRAGDEPLYLEDGGEVLVTAVTDSLRDAIAGLPDEARLHVATQWADALNADQEPDAWGRVDADDLDAFLAEFGALAARAVDSGHHLYCWSSM